MKTSNGAGQSKIGASSMPAWRCSLTGPVTIVLVADGSMWMVRWLIVQLHHGHVKPVECQSLQIAVITVYVSMNKYTAMSQGQWHHLNWVCEKGSIAVEERYMEFERNAEQIYSLYCIWNVCLLYAVVCCRLETVLYSSQPLVTWRTSGTSSVCGKPGTAPCLYESSGSTIHRRLKVETDSLRLRYVHIFAMFSQFSYF